MDLDAIGTTLADRYRLDALLGRGAVGCVYAATDLALDRPVAVKVVRPELAADAALVGRFVREAKIVAQLAANPHVLTVYDLGFAEDGRPFIVTEHLRGRSLASVMRDKYRPARSWVLDAGRQVALALLDVHRRGITHRDVKPGNLFLVEAPGLPLLVKLIDFGLSHSPRFAPDGTEPGSVAGTIRYLAPEVIDGEEPTPAADVYAFGITLYELATGGYPYAASSAEELLAAHRQAAPAPFPEDESPFPETFRALVLQMLSKRRTDRPSAEVCLQDLRLADRELDEARGNG
ncbi:MAG TPA: serine/threonine-protein kinase [Gemmataceae bacterium]|jgi:serine/threonine-protein kinase